MDVFDAGVVHSAGAAGFRVQSAFKNRAEDGGADFAPIKGFAGLAEDQVNDFVAQAGDFNVFIGKQAAVDIGEGG